MFHTYVTSWYSSPLFFLFVVLFKKTKSPFSEKIWKGTKKSALPPKFCNKITALNVLSYAFLLTEDSGETYWLENKKCQSMFSPHLREDICYWKCTCSHQPQALWTILLKNSVVLFNEFRWSYVFDELHYSPIFEKVKKKIVLIFVHCQIVDSKHILKEVRKKLAITLCKRYNKSRNMQVLIDGLAKIKDKNLRKLRGIHNNSIAEIFSKRLGNWIT